MCGIATLADEWNAMNSLLIRAVAPGQTHVFGVLLPLTRSLVAR
jgi:hypothetical protein